LLASGHEVHALTRPHSATRLPPGANAVIGDALDAASFKERIPRGATFIHLVGTPHPSPVKAVEFRRVDLVSIQAAISAALSAGVAHFVYVSVAHPAPVMQAYIAVRSAGEALLQAAGLPSTVLRPWSVLGPGHRWPYALVPLYALLRLNPATRATALRLGLVTLEDMLRSLEAALLEPCAGGVRVVEVPAMLASRRSTRTR
ncbi:MAG TPA: NAD(P)H-binding protein, partial [Candidatus Dormibacteraeota bacterium]|nr:NAD(P)H-binding protein [Candidatus Dormibacteraeota bacterium]